MNRESLLQKGQMAIARGLEWLRVHEPEISRLGDLSAHYKAPYLYAVLGDPVRARRYADLMRHRYQQADGDFRTGHNRMWAESLLTYSLVWRIIFIPHMITLSLKPQRTCASHRQMKATAPHRF